MSQQAKVGSPYLSGIPEPTASAVPREGEVWVGRSLAQAFFPWTSRRAEAVCMELVRWIVPKAAIAEPQ